MDPPRSPSMYSGVSARTPVEGGGYSPSFTGRGGLQSGRATPMSGRSKGGFDPTAMGSQAPPPPPPPMASGGGFDESKGGLTGASFTKGGATGASFGTGTKGFASKGGLSPPRSGATTPMGAPKPPPPPGTGKGGKGKR